MITKEITLYHCTVCNTTKSVEDGDKDIIEVTLSFCKVCKFYNSIKKLGKFRLECVD